MSRRADDLGTSKPAADGPSGTDFAWGRWLALAAVARTIAVAAAFAPRFVGQDPTLVDSPLIGQRVPDVTLPYLEKVGEVALQELSGQVLVINFWASWCVACKEEHADLLLAAQRYRDRGVRFLGIVYQDEPTNAIRLLDDMGRGYDNLLDPAPAPRSTSASSGSPRPSSSTVTAPSSARSPARRTSGCCHRRSRGARRGGARRATGPRLRPPGAAPGIIT